MSVEEKSTQPADLEKYITSTLKEFGLATSIWERGVTKEEVQYFLDRWPYIQILSRNKIEAFPSVQLNKASSNWIIHNFGNAMTTSPGEFIYGGGDYTINLNPDDEEDSSGGIIVNPGKGTLWQQAFDTVADMVMLAIKQGWTGIHVVDGHDVMKWAVWMHTLDSESLELSGFEPSKKDQERRERLKRGADYSTMRHLGMKRK